jgi:Flp pilus assembly protein TadG
MRSAVLNRAAFARDESGGVLVEVSIVLPIIITFIFGSVDLLYALYQWNAAAKAVEVGSRIAAVSDPIAAGLNGLTNSVAVSLNGAGEPLAMPAFTISCNGETATCTCAGTCNGLAANPYDAVAMNRLVFGRGSTACGDATSYYATGMCDVLSSIRAANVIVVYRQTGLGYGGRPGGPQPTIIVSLQNMRFQFFFLSYLLGASVPMPAMTTTITAEDLCSGGGSGSCGS